MKEIEKKDEPAVSGGYVPLQDGPCLPPYNPGFPQPSYPQNPSGIPELKYQDPTQ
jgi:hypothetical protein